MQDGANDVTALREETKTLLGQVVRLAQDAGATTAARGLRDERLARLVDGRFHLVVLGEFNHGKTTLVNALLGKSLLPVSVTPTTNVIHRISHGAATQTRVLGADGVWREVSADELDAYSVDGARANDGAKEIDLALPSSFLEDGVVLVDTPGVNDLSLTRAEITYDYVPRADAVLFVLDAGQILKESERAFVEQKLLASARDKIFFVVNKIDLLDAAERDEALSYARAQLEKIVAHPRIFAVSSTRALAADATSGVAELTHALQQFLRDDRGRVLVDLAIADGLRTLASLRQGAEILVRTRALDEETLTSRIAALERELEGTAQTRQARQAAVRDAFTALRAVTRRDCDAFAERFASTLPAEIERARGDDLKKYMQAFIEERVRRFADDEAAEVTRRLEAITQDVVLMLADDARARNERVRQALGVGMAALDMQVPTFAWDVGVVALGAFGVTMLALSSVLAGGALLLAAPVLAVVSRNHAESQLKARLVADAPRAVRDAVAALAASLDSQLAQLCDQLLAFLAETTEETTRAVAEMLRRSRDARASERAERAHADAQTDTLLARIDSFTRSLESARARVWMPAPQSTR